jgi:hypothetical protein
MDREQRMKATDLAKTMTACNREGVLCLAKQGEKPLHGNTRTALQINFPFLIHCSGCIVLACVFKRQGRETDSFYLHFFTFSSFAKYNCFRNLMKEA